MYFKVCIGWNDLNEVLFRICIKPLLCYVHGPPDKYQQLIVHHEWFLTTFFLMLTGFEPCSLLCLWIVGVITYGITDNILNPEYARFLFSGDCKLWFIWEFIPFISGLTQYNSQIIPLRDMLTFSWYLLWDILLLGAWDNSSLGMLMFTYLSVTLDWSYWYINAAGD